MREYRARVTRLGLQHLLEQVRGAIEYLRLVVEVLRGADVPVDTQDAIQLLPRVRFVSYMRERIERSQPRRLVAVFRRQVAPDLSCYLRRPFSSGNWPEMNSNLSQREAGRYGVNAM